MCRRLLMPEMISFANHRKIREAYYLHCSRVSVEWSSLLHQLLKEFDQSITSHTTYVEQEKHSLELMQKCDTRFKDILT